MAKQKKKNKSKTGADSSTDKIPTLISSPLNISSGNLQTVKVRRAKGQQPLEKEKPLMSKKSRKQRAKDKLKRDKMTSPTQLRPTVYGPAESRKALDARGFHPEVTKLSPEQIIARAKAFFRARLLKPTITEFKNGPGFRGYKYARKRNVTQAPLIHRPEWEAVFRTGSSDMMEDISNTRSVTGQNDPSIGIFSMFAGHRSVSENSPSEPEDENSSNPFLIMLQSEDIGGMLVQAIIQEGYDAVQNLASTSCKAWRAVTTRLQIWDFLGGKFRQMGPARTFIVVTPEYTIGDFRQLREVDPHGISNHPLASWYALAISKEKELLDTIFTIRVRSGSIAPFWPGNNIESVVNSPAPACITDNVEPRAVQAIQCILNPNRIWEAGQFGCNVSCHTFEPLNTLAVMRLEATMKQIFKQRAAIQVLNFHETPMLDRRMIAIILRACTSVTSVGIYNCPLVHFGDVICLLDLIHEINKERRRGGGAQITHFDFFPRYHAGMPYQHPRAQTYGLFWSPRKIDQVQRGFYNLIMKAFFKSEGMGLKLLFWEHGAFRKYLDRVPNAPLGVSTFLDALYRYRDLNRTSPNLDAEKKEIFYDLLKFVRIDLAEDLSRDWSKWYNHTMGKDLIFCACCGYETFEEFYSCEARCAQPHRRMCAGCMVLYQLDREVDHFKEEKVAILRKLCENWEGFDFNDDAPLHRSANGMLGLRSKVSERPEPPGLYVNGHGNLVRPSYMEPLVRDFKQIRDSLQKLPDLEYLVSEEAKQKEWYQAAFQAQQLDLYCRAVRRLTAENPVCGGDTVPFGPHRVDAGMPDHVEERQPAWHPRWGKQTHNCQTALQLQDDLDSCGW